MLARIAPFAVYANIFLVMLGLGVIGPNLTDIREDLGVSYGTISWGVSAFALARLVTNIPASRAAAAMPRLPLLMAGTFAVAAGGVVAAASDGIVLFLVSRAVQGVGSSISTTVGLMIVLDGSDSAHRGRASGTFHSAMGGGALFGPGFGALLAGFGGWRAALLGSAGAAAVSFALLALLTGRLAGAAGGSAPGAAPSRVGVPRPSLGKLVFGTAAAAYAAAFTIFFLRGGMQQTVVPLMGRDEAGLSVTALSLLLMLSAGVSTFLGTFAGVLSDRVGRLRVLVPGLLVLMAGTCVLAAGSSAPLFVAGVVLMSFAGATSSVPSSMIVDAVEAADRSWAIGVYRVVGDSALFVAPIISGSLVDSSGFAAAALLSASLVAVTLLVMWAVRPAEAAPRYSPEAAKGANSAT